MSTGNQRVKVGHRLVFWEIAGITSRDQCREELVQVLVFFSFCVQKAELAMGTAKGVQRWEQPK